MPDRSDLMLGYFDYLTKEYGFSVERKEFAPEAMGNAVLRLTSPTVGIEIAIDRDDVLILIGDPRDETWDWYEFGDVLKYYAPEIENAYESPAKTPDNTWDEVVETQLVRLSKILRQYCEPLLQGKPLMKAEIKKIEENRVAKKYGRFMQGLGKRGD